MLRKSLQLKITLNSYNLKKMHGKYFSKTIGIFFIFILRYTDIVNQLDGDKNFLRKNIVDYYNHCCYIAAKDYVEYR